MRERERRRNEREGRREKPHKKKLIKGEMMKIPSHVTVK
jgi:hypothetical protein